MPIKWPAAGIVAAALALDATSASGQVSYTVTDLGALGGSSTVATAVNSSGQVVGSASIPGDDVYVRHPFLWDHGTMQDLGLLPGYRQCTATAINDGGQVVGWCAFPPGTDQGFERAFMWSAGSGIVDLGLPNNTEALGMNNHGDVVGFTSADAFVLHSDGVFSDLGPGEASAINDIGQIAGTTLRPDFRRATVWDGSGAHDLGTLDDPGPFASSDAYAINAYGKVVGRSSTAGDPEDEVSLHAILWDADGTGNLGTLGGSWALALAISGELIVGTSRTMSHEQHAFLYDNNGPGYPVDLNSLISPDAGVVLNYATGINSSGQIVGWGCLSPSGGRVCGYLLTPVTPSTPRQ